MYRHRRGVPGELLSRGPHTCEHGTEVGTAGRQDHPVGWYFNTSCHQLDITQYLFAKRDKKLLSLRGLNTKKVNTNKQQKLNDVTLLIEMTFSMLYIYIYCPRNAPPQVVHQLESLSHVRMVESGHPSIHGVLLGVRGAVWMWHSWCGHQAGKTREAMSGWERQTWHMYFICSDDEVRRCK